MLRKTTLVSSNANGRLAVRTLSFKRPTCLREARIDLGDVLKIVIPNYKPKSYSISDLRQTEFDITVKMYPKGRASGYLDRMKIGESVRVFLKAPYARQSGGTHVGIVGFGVGITEALPVAEAELNKSRDVTLLWACRRRDEMFWDSRIKALQKQFPSTFKIVRVLSREKRPGALHGRIDIDVLKKVFAFGDDVPPNHMRFVRVGTKRMMRCVDKMLKRLKYDVQGRHSLFRRRGLIERAFASESVRAQ